MNHYIFKNNSVRITGSILYGGQFDICRLFYRTTASTEQPVCKANHYSDNALEIFKTMSTIVQHENSESVLSTSSQTREIDVCKGDERLLASITERYLHPGEKFNISIIAVGQTNDPVPTTFFFFWKLDTEMLNSTISVQRTKVQGIHAQIFPFSCIQQI